MSKLHEPNCRTWTPGYVVIHPPSVSNFSLLHGVRLFTKALTLSMEITEEQRQRAEANRLAAIGKRKAALESGKQSQLWKFFKCRRASPESTTATTASRLPEPLKPSNDALLKPHLGEKFRVNLEICSPDSFSITPEAVRGFAYPGEAECLKRLNHCLANVRFSILWSDADAQRRKMKFGLTVLFFYVLDSDENGEF